MDMNTKKLTNNAYRVTKTRGKTALRVRVPGGHFDVKYFDILKKISEEYGNGEVHITTRQGFEIPDIDFDKVDEINQVSCNTGYPAAGIRNVAVSIGKRVCRSANYDTAAFAKKIENAIFPNDFHVKIALTGCPNDCIKARMHNFRIIGMTVPQYDKYRCVGCEACAKYCKRTCLLVIEFLPFTR